MRFFQYLSIVSLFLLISACGGGGGSTDSSGGSTSGTDQSNIVVQGRWDGRFEIDVLSCGGSMSFNFNQSGTASEISGSVTADLSACGGGVSNSFTFTGTVSGSRVQLTDNEGDTYDLSLAQGSSDVLVGTISSSGLGATATVNVTRQGG